MNRHINKKTLTIVLAIVAISCVATASAAVLLQRTLNGSIHVNSRMLEVYSDQACTQVITALPGFPDQYLDAISGVAPATVTIYMKNIDTGTHTLSITADLQNLIPPTLPAGVTISISSHRNAPNQVDISDLKTSGMQLVSPASSEGQSNPAATYASVTVTFNGISGTTPSGNYQFTLDLNAIVVGS